MYLIIQPGCGTWYSSTSCSSSPENSVVRVSTTLAIQLAAEYVHKFWDLELHFTTEPCQMIDVDGSTNARQRPSQHERHRCPMFECECAGKKSNDLGDETTQNNPEIARLPKGATTAPTQTANGRRSAMIVRLLQSTRSGEATKKPRCSEDNPSLFPLQPWILFAQLYQIKSYKSTVFYLPHIIGVHTRVETICL